MNERERERKIKEKKIMNFTNEHERNMQYVTIAWPMPFKLMLIPHLHIGNNVCFAKSLIHKIY